MKNMKLEFSNGLEVDTVDRSIGDFDSSVKVLVGLAITSKFCTVEQARDGLLAVAERMTCLMEDVDDYERQ